MISTRLSTTLRLLVLLAFAAPAAAEPVLFVTQTPESGDFANLFSVFANHRGQPWHAPRGGDLYIRYDDGTLRNLTAEAGYGTTPGAEITVRDPCVYWDGTKALFSMAVGGTTQNDYTPTYFQIYEITGIAQGGAAAIAKLPQPAQYNNVTPNYATDDSIIFTSDRPRNGDRRLYPQLDEYESTPTNTGIWRMDADGTGLALLDHAPSGDFRPSVDSFGRIVFTRWDHLQRDQQADGDIDDLIDGQAAGYGSFTYDSEEADTSHPIAPGDEIYPEARYLHSGDASNPDPIWDADHVAGERDHRFNQFFPWMMREDGTGLETLNHIGRHELFSYIQSSRNGLPDFNPSDGSSRIVNFLTPTEDPTQPGFYYAIDAPEFATHAAGQIIALNAPPSANADDMRVEYVTHPETRSYYTPGDVVSPNHVGMFRDPMVRADGSLWAAHSTSTYADAPTAVDPGSPAQFPISSRYDFAIKQLVDGTGSYKVPGDRLVPGGIVKAVSYFDNSRYRTISYNGPLWELQPVSVVARPRPTPAAEPIPAIELDILRTELGGDNGIEALRTYLIQHDLALIVSRDVTVRADRQQDYNLKIAWSAHQTADGGSTPKEIGWMQFFEARQVRGYTGLSSGGRRLLARHMVEGINPLEPGRPTGGVRLGDDGSMAAFVPARRALSWQTTTADGTPSVRERYWLTFQPGEIRTCTNCHGLNQTDVFGGPIPTNPPQALVDLLQWWRDGAAPETSGWVLF